MSYWSACKRERECRGSCSENSLNHQENNSKEAYCKTKTLLNLKKDSVTGVSEAIQHNNCG